MYPKVNTANTPETPRESNEDRIEAFVYDLRLGKHLLFGVGVVDKSCR